MKKTILIICIFMVSVLSFPNKITFARESIFSYVYDKNNRITTVLEKSEPIIDFLYDKNGNFIKKSKISLDSPETLFPQYLSHNKAIFSWNKVKSSTSYIVEFDDKNITVNAPYLELTNLESEKEYIVKLTSKNSVNSARTPLIFAFKTIIAPPTNLKVIPTENGIKLFWDKVLNAEYYTIYEKDRYGNFRAIGRTSDLDFEVNNHLNLQSIQEFYVTSFKDNESEPSESVVYYSASITNNIYEENNTKETAYPITVGSYTAYIQTLNDVDYYEIKAPPGSYESFTLTFIDTGNINFRYQMFSEIQGILTETELPLGPFSSIDYDSKGKYYIKVSANNEFSTEYPYTINVGFTQLQMCEMCIPLDPIKPPLETSYFSPLIDKNKYNPIW